jgi:hypothetical protein
MSHQLFTIAILSTTLVLGSCQSSTTAETDPTLVRAQTIYAEAIEVHDEVMPRMDEIVQMRQKLKLRVDSMLQQDTIALADSLQRMRAAIQNLNEADRAMMQWMRGVQKVPGSDETSDYQDELNTTQLTDTVGLVQRQQAQKDAIVQVKQQMEQSISEAERMIGLPADE